jgi:L-aminopeptidase/D-esterase-like protein
VVELLGVLINWCRYQYALQDADLHIVVAATHQFDKNVMQTLVQENVNPLDRIEHSMLILGSSVHRVAVDKLLNPANVKRIATSAPALFANTSAAPTNNLPANTDLSRSA